ncbi:hypothetical protein LWC34_02865 [Kibdelosporangium philippinense]|uniref:Uncharacterized protein n=1 Tax=Kibdelosporangium philippinense TaxID=211113 RepID=A0ABS8Z1H1_9PSEU|nr:hypothetical protein [Kibdelosporangium philippinense]
MTLLRRPTATKRWLALSSRLRQRAEVIDVQEVTPCQVVSHTEARYGNDVSGRIERFHEAVAPGALLADAFDELGWTGEVRGRSSRIAG